MPKKTKIKETHLPQFISSDNLTPDVFGAIEKLYSAAQPEPGLDLLPGCLAPGAVSVICTRPGEGKSGFLLSLALEAQDRKLNVAIFLTDHRREEFIVKAIAARAGVSPVGIKRGRAKREDWPQLTRAAGKLLEPPLYFSAHSLITDWALDSDVRELAAALKEDGRKLDLVIVDSLNYVKCDENSPDPLTTIANLAAGLRVPFVCSYGLPSYKHGERLIPSLGSVRLAGLDDNLVSHLYVLHRQEYYDRLDPTVKNRGSLYRLAPEVSKSQGMSDLEVNPDSVTYKRIHPVVLKPIGKTEVF